jgi:hypothetical protein
MAQSITERMIGAAFLDVNTYEEVEADETATGQAAVVVVMVAAAQAIGSAGSGGLGMVMAAIMAVIGWGIWAAVTYVVGDKIFGGTATWGELLRTLGFAQAPGLLGILAILPLVGGLTSLVVAVWTLITGVVAIRQALDFSTGKAILTALISMVVIIGFMLTMATLFGAAVVGGSALL